MLIIVALGSIVTILLYWLNDHGRSKRTTKESDGRSYSRQASFVLVVAAQVLIMIQVMLQQNESNQSAQRLREMLIPITRLNVQFQMRNLPDTVLKSYYREVNGVQVMLPDDSGSLSEWLSFSDLLNSTKTPYGWFMLSMTHEPEIHIVVGPQWSEDKGWGKTLKCLLIDDTLRSECSSSIAQSGVTKGDAWPSDPTPGYTSVDFDMRWVPQDFRSISQRRLNSLTAGMLNLEDSLPTLFFNIPARTRFDPPNARTDREGIAQVRVLPDLDESIIRAIFMRLPEYIRVVVGVNDSPVKQYDFRREYRREFVPGYGLRIQYRKF